MFLRKKKNQSSDAAGETISSGQRYNLIREEENRRYLKELLSRRRPQAVQKRILRVLQYEEDLFKKIDIVEKVDSRGVDALEMMERRIRLVEERNNRKSGERDGKYRYEVPGRIPAPSRSGVVSKRKKGFLRFLFADFRKITVFGRLHLLLKPRFSRGRHEFTDEFLRFWNVELKVMLNFLEEPLRFFLREGWREVSPLQYNLAVRLKQLIRIYREGALLIFDKKPSARLFSTMEPFLSEWIAFLARPDYKELLLDGLHTFVQGRKEFKMVSRKILMAADSLFILKKNGPCLKNAALALFMACRKEFLGFEEFRRRYTAVKVNSTGWDAADDVVEKIRFFIDARRGELDEIGKQIYFLSEMKITGIEQMEEGVLLALFDLYSGKRSASGEAGKTPVQSCRQLLKYDLVSFFEKVIANLIFTSAPVLCPAGPVPEAWMGISFSEELEQLTEKLEQIRTIRVTHERMTIPSDFYSRVLHQQALPGTLSDTERDYCAMLRSISSSCYRIAVKVNHLAAQSGVLSGEPATFLQEASRGGTQGAWFNGMGAADIYEDLTGAALGVALILEEGSLMELIRKRSAMEARAEELSIILRRMDPEG